MNASEIREQYNAGHADFTWGWIGPVIGTLLAEIDRLNELLKIWELAQ